MDNEPIWAAAARALAAGLISTPPRHGTVRPPSTYEMNPDEEAWWDDDWGSP